MSEVLNLSQQNEEEEHLPGRVDNDFPAMARQRTKGNMHRPGHVEVKPSEESHVLLINDQDTEALANNSSSEVQETEQQKVYTNCIRLFDLFAYFLGIRMEYSWKPLRHVLFYICLLSLVFVAFEIGYTTYNYCSKGDYVKSIEPISISGILLSCTSKLIAYLKHRQHILSLYFMMRRYLRSDINGRQGEIVLLNVRKAWNLILKITGGCIVSATIFAVIPIGLYITTKEVTPVLPIDVIFCDMTQTSGFIIGTFIQVFMGVYSAEATSFHASLIIFCISTYLMQCDFIEKDFEDLNAMWDGKNKIPLWYKHAFLKNICKKRQDMNEFLSVLKHCYEQQLFEYFCYCYFAQILVLFEVTQNDWTGGYGLISGIFSEMLIYCYLGTQITIANDKLCYVIYDCNWHTYDMQSQKMILLLLHDAQQPKELQVGLIGPLNLVTGVTIIKSIYSYYTVMKELF